MPASVSDEGKTTDQISVEDRVVALQIRLLFENSIDVPISLINASILVAMVWDLYPIWILLPWIVLFVVVNVTRSVLRARYLRSARASESSILWGQRYTANAFCSGFLWGLTGTLILATSDPAVHLFIIFLLGGMMAGGTIYTAAYMPAMLGFMLPTIVPALVALSIHGGRMSIEMAIMLTLFTIVLAIAGRSMNRSIIENFRIRIEQTSLMDKLSISEAAMAEAQVLAHVGSWQLDPRAKRFSGSTEAYRIFGLDPATFNPNYEAVFAHIYPSDRAMLEEKIAESLTTKKGHEVYHRVVRDSGEIRYVHLITRLKSDADGNALSLIGTIEDITERRQAEAAKAQLAAIVDSSVDAIAAATIDGIITSWNRGAEFLYGYAAEEIIGKDVQITIPGMLREEAARNRETLKLGGDVKPFDTERLTKDGRAIPVSISVSSIADVAGKVIGFAFISRDITDRIRASEAVAYGDRLLHAVNVGTAILVKAESVEQKMPEALRVVAAGMRVDRVLVMQEPETPMSPPALRYVWQDPGVPVAVDQSTFLVPLEDRPAMDAWRAGLNRGSPLIAQLTTSEGPVRAMLERSHNKSTLLVPISLGNKRWGSLAVDSCSVVREWTPSEIETMKSFGDIVGSLIVHSETSLLLTKSEERYRILNATAQDAIITTDHAGLVLQWNLAAERMLGYSAQEAYGKRAHQLLAPASRRDQSDPALVIEGDALGKTMELTVVRKDGTEIAVELSVSGARLGGNWESIVVMRDITERKTAATKLQFANSLLKSEMEASPYGIMVVAPNREIILFNQKLGDIWKVPRSELAGMDMDSAIAKATPLLGDARVFTARVNYLLSHPGEDSQEELDLTDGRVIIRESVTLFDGEGRYVARVWYFRDITESKLAENALAYRDRLVQAVMISTGILIQKDSLYQGMPEALRLMGESMAVDRILVMQDFSQAHPPLPVVHYSWEVPGIAMSYERALPTLKTLDFKDLVDWRAPLQAGMPVLTQLETSKGTVRALLEFLQNKSTLQVPISVDGKLWGSFGIDSCIVPREWTASEVATLQTLAGITGSLIQRAETRLSLERSEERFRVLGATAEDAIIMIGGTGRITSWNRAAERILGYSAQEAIGRYVHELLVPERFREKADHGMKGFLLNGSGDALGKTTQLAATRKDGTEISVELSLAGAQVGTEWQAIGILRDVTERKVAEDKLQFANILLKTEMEASPDGILVVDVDGKVTSFNQRFSEMWSVPLTALTVGDDYVLLSKVSAQVKDSKAFSARVQHLYGHPGEDGEEQIELTDGRFMDRHTKTLYTPAGGYLGRAWFFRDITQSKLAAELALQMARFDVLTGLANRSVFVEALEHAIFQAKRGEAGCAVVYLDLDHFKDVNDTLGHPVGDALLQAVADRLRSSIRAVDTIARFGGDEFAVVVANVAEPADAAILAEKLIVALAAPYSIQGYEIYSAASVGIDLYGPESSNAETLLSHADVALYRAKSEGRGGYRFFTDAMDAEVRLQVSLGTELHEALDAGQLFLMYQPQVEIDSGKISGVEALVRWRHPKRGILSPGLFIPVAEKVGIIGRIGHWVLLTACRQARAWIDAGADPIRIAVNVSALQFKSPVALEADVVSILSETRLPARLLELELTETVLMNVSLEHSDIVTRLRQIIGVTIAIDDFGTGYSSLDYLRRFPVDRIKVAQSFVEHLETLPGNASIVKATIGMAHELGTMIIVEGVETETQLELLKSWGCAEIQGFYFAKPLPPEEITLLLKDGGILKPKVSSTL